MLKIFSTQIVWLGARFTGAFAGLIFQIFLARVLAPAELGLFFAVSSLAAIGGILATQGYPNLASRFISRYVQRENPRRLAQFLGWLRQQTIRASLAISAAVILAAFVYPDVDHGTRVAYALAGTCIPAMAMLTLLAATGVAQRQLLIGLFPDLVCRPVLLAGFAVGVFWWNTPMNASGAMLAFTLIAFVIAVVQFRMMNHAPTSIPATTRLTRFWRNEAWTLLVVMLFTAFFGDLAILCASLFLPSAELATFGVAMKIGMIVGFGVQIAHQILLPDLADAYARRRPEEVAHILTKGAYFPVAFTVACFILLALFGHFVLQLYGKQFEQALGPLLTLVACQLVRAIGGPSQNLMTLRGLQKTNLAVCVVACSALLLGNLLLTLRFGLWGATASAAMAYIVWIIGGCIMLDRKEGLRSDLLASFSASRKLRLVRTGEG